MQKILHVRILFMINGGITVRTTSAKSNRQNTFMVGALGQGGRGMYALNIGGKALDSGNAIGLNAEVAHGIRPCRYMNPIQ